MNLVAPILELYSVKVILLLFLNFRIAIWLAVWPPDFPTPVVEGMFWGGLGRQTPRSVSTRISKNRKDWCHCRTYMTSFRDMPREHTSSPPRSGSRTSLSFPQAISVVLEPRVVRWVQHLLCQWTSNIVRVWRFLGGCFPTSFIRCTCSEYSSRWEQSQ